MTPTNSTGDKDLTSRIIATIKQEKEIEDKLRTALNYNYYNDIKYVHLYKDGSYSFAVENKYGVSLDQILRTIQILKKHDINVKDDDVFIVHDRTITEKDKDKDNKSVKVKTYLIRFEVKP